MYARIKKDAALSECDLFLAEMEKLTVENNKWMTRARLKITEDKRSKSKA